MQAIERIRAALEALKPDLRQTWVKLDKLPYIHATDDPTAKPYSTPVVGRFDYMESADYILECNPAAMSEVLAHIDKLEAENELLRKDAERRPMTTDDVADCMFTADIVAQPNKILAFARAIEAFHKIKGTP